MFVAFGILLVLVIGLAVSAPYLASTGPVRHYALAKANEYLVGAFEVEGLSLGWGGPLELRGVRIADASEREVLRVENVRCARGLWGLLTGRLDFGDITVERPRAALHVSAANDISLVGAFRPRSPSATSADSSPLPEVRGKVVIHDGGVRATREGGPSYEVSRLNATVNLDTLARITAELAMQLADGTPLTLEGDVRELVTGGALSPLAASGKLRVQTGGDVQLGPLTEFLTPGRRIDGALNLKLDAAGTADNVQADFAANVSGLQTPDRAQEHAAPLNLAVTGRLTREGESLTGQADLTGDAGRAQATMSYRLAALPPDVTAERVLSAILKGESMQLPELDLAVTGGIDLARLGQAVPGLLRLRPESEITGGRLEIARFSAQGGPAPSAKGEIRLSGITAKEAGRAVEVQPMTLNFDAAVVPGEGLRIAVADLKSSFAEVTAKGGASAVTAGFKADLARLQQELSQIVDLGALGLAGDLTGTLEFQRLEGQSDFQVTFKADAAGLRTVKNASAAVNLGVTGTMERRADNLTARGNLTGDTGVAEVGLTYRLSEAMPPLTAQKLLSAALTGEALSLPACAVNVHGNVDLARLASAVPGLLRVREGLEISGGRLELTKVTAQGGAAPSVTGGITLTGVTAMDHGKALSLEPITVGFDAKLVEDRGLEVGLAELKSSFAEVTAKGAASNVQASFRANLAQLEQEIGQFVDLSGFALAGDVSGTAELARAAEDRVDMTVSADAVGLRYAAGDRVLDVQRATLRQSGHLTLRDKAVTRIDVAGAEVDFDGQTAMSATGWYDLASGGFQAAVDVKRGDMSYAAARLGSLGVTVLTGYSGGVSGRLTAERSSAAETLLSSGSLTARDLALDARPVLEGESQIEWKGLRVSPDGARIDADSAELRSAAATLTAAGVRVQTGSALEAAADVKGSADLARAIRVIAALTRMEKPPAVAGQLGLDAKVATVAGVVSYTGKGGVDQLQVGMGEKLVREKRLDFDFDGQLDDPRDRITLSKFRLASTPLTAEVNGAIEQYKNTCVFSLKGRYDASWKELTAVLHELVPDTAETIILAGQSASAFEITGPLRGPNRAVEMRTLNSGADVGWASADIFGVGMGGAKLSPVLRDGRLTIPKTSIPAAEGKVNLQADIDFRTAEPTLNIPGKLAVLDNVAVTSLLSASLLGRINPIFHHSTKVDGRIRLTTQDIMLPLGDGLTQGGSGTGVLDLQRIKIQPTGLLASLLELGGFPADKPYPIEIGKVDLLIKDGRIHYDNFALSFPDDFTLIFRGSVGFDSTLDLVISVPVREGLLRRLGMKAGATELLGPSPNLRVDLPLAGTRENPNLDFAKVDVASLLKGAVPKSTEKLADDLLKGILGGDKSKEKPQAPPPPPPKKKRPPGRP